MNETAKQYYWLKLPKDFFTDKAIKRLRKLAGGDTYTIIYLKMMLASLELDGKMFYEGLEKTFEDEIALDIDEDADNVAVTINFLKSAGLLECGESEAELLQLKEMVGSETESARALRKWRQSKKVHSGAKETKAVAHFMKPTIEEVREYCAERRNGIDAEQFFDFYESKGWKVGKNSMKDWKACVRTWERNQPQNRQGHIVIDTPDYWHKTYKPSGEKMTAEELDELKRLQKELGKKDKLA